MQKKIKQIKYDNRSRPKSQFELVKLENLLSKGIENTISKINTVDFYIILICTGGNGYHTIDFTDYQYKKRTILTIRKDQIHKYFISNAKGYLLFFKEDFIVSYLEKEEALRVFQLFNELLGTQKIILEDSDYSSIIQLTKSMEIEYYNRVDEYSPGIIRSLLHILITKLHRAKSKNGISIIDGKYLAEFVGLQRLVEKNCFSTKKVADYANKIGVTSKTLNNVVQSIVHKSAKLFIDEIAITQIKRLLINSPLSINEIAFIAGFDEPTNLYKYFKKYTDTSPGAFRRSYK